MINNCVMPRLKMLTNWLVKERREQLGMNNALQHQRPPGGRMEHGAMSGEQQGLGREQTARRPKRTAFWAGCGWWCVPDGAAGHVRSGMELLGIRACQGSQWRARRRRQAEPSRTPAPAWTDRCGPSRHATRGSCPDGFCERDCDGGRDEKKQQLREERIEETSGRLWKCAIYKPSGSVQWR